MKLFLQEDKRVISSLHHDGFQGAVQPLNLRNPMEGPDRAFLGVLECSHVRRSVRNRKAPYPRFVPNCSGRHSTQDAEEHNVDSQASFALFGIGDIVFDPTSCASLVSQLATLESQYNMLKNNVIWPPHVPILSHTAIATAILCTCFFVWQRLAFHWSYSRRAKSPSTCCCSILRLQ
jgi:hypothetical protein